MDWESHDPEVNGCSDEDERSADDSVEGAGCAGGDSGAGGDGGGGVIKFTNSVKELTSKPLLTSL